MGEASRRGTFEERRERAISERFKGRIVKVRFSPSVFVHFFEQSDRAFQCNAGLPQDSELVTILQPIPSNGERDWVAVFEHESFREVQNMKEAPFIEVTYTAYQLQNQEDKAPDEMAVAQNQN